MNIFDFIVKDKGDNDISLAEYKGKVVLIVNTASGCGLTPQLEGLEQLYKKYGPDNFVILGFPCNQFGNQEKGSNTEIQQFCQLNYGVTFPIFGKIDVNGKNADPLFHYLTKTTGGLLGGKVKWNFTKFLFDQNGQFIERFGPIVKPEAIEKTILSLCKK